MLIFNAKINKIIVALNIINSTSSKADQRYQNLKLKKWNMF